MNIMVWCVLIGMGVVGAAAPGEDQPDAKRRPQIYEPGPPDCRCPDPTPRSHAMA